MPQRRLLAITLAGLLAMVGFPGIGPSTAVQAQSEQDCEDVDCVADEQAWEDTEGEDSGSWEDEASADTESDDEFVDETEAGPEPDEQSGEDAEGEDSGSWEDEASAEPESDDEFADESDDEAGDSAFESDEAAAERDRAAVVAADGQTQSSSGVPVADPARNPQVVEPSSGGVRPASPPPAAPNPRMKTGVVSFYNHTKGYGWLKDDETGKELFIQATLVIDEYLNQGDKVSFEIMDGQKAQNAVNVKKINPK